MLSYILPTRNRPQRLEETLNRLGQLSLNAHDAIGGCEAIVVDNFSTLFPSFGGRLANGMKLRVIRLHENLGAAARNIGAAQADGDWLFMLDDDSYPVNCAHVPVLCEVEDDVGAVGAQIMLCDGRREAGGLPEVIIGCGAAIRRQAFLNVGGYDPAFHYYVEEYDLCAKLIRGGWRIVHDFRMLVRHEKISEGRDMNLILQRLVRNNGWVAQRHAPVEERARELARTIQRYASIAMKEGAARGFAEGTAQLLESLDHQWVVPLERSQFDRFSGAAHVRCDGSGAAHALVDRGKNDWVIEQVLSAAGCRVVDGESDAEVLVIGTLSPGPMVDAYQSRVRSHPHQRVAMPWLPRGVPGFRGEPACERVAAAV